MGALTYHPTTEQDIPENTVLDLHELALQSQQIYAGAEGEVLPLLLRAGGCFEAAGWPKLNLLRKSANVRKNQVRTDFGMQQMDVWSHDQC